MKKTLLLYKPLSITPLQYIQHFRQQNPEYSKVKLGYAGRLDPMAEGLILILVGEENKKRKSYEDLPKEYECEVLFGIETDTYDVLGKIINVIERNPEEEKDESISQKLEPNADQIKHILKLFIGKQDQPYPPYSSQPVNGKPLYYWARNQQLDTITIPTKAIEIYEIQVLKQKEISTENLQKIIFERISKVIGDFRQEEIIGIWKDFFTKYPNQMFPVFHFRIYCSSGTYIRSFAHNLGKKLGISAIALSITRTKIGDRTLKNAIMT